LRLPVLRMEHGATRAPATRTVMSRTRTGTTASSTSIGTIPTIGTPISAPVWQSRPAQLWAGFTFNVQEPPVGHFRGFYELFLHRKVFLFFYDVQFLAQSNKAFEYIYRYPQLFKRSDLLSFMGERRFCCQDETLNREVFYPRKDTEPLALSDLLSQLIQFFIYFAQRMDNRSADRCGGGSSKFV